MKTPTPEINPYEVTALSAPSAPTPSQAAALVERKYQLHMHWADRRRFLKAVDPLRFVAIIGFLTGGMGLLGAIGSLGEIWRVGEPVLTTRRIISFLQVVVFLSLQWQWWKLAGAIAVAVGGRDPDMTNWSKLQMRIAWLLLITLLINSISWATEWAVYFFQRLSSL